MRPRRASWTIWGVVVGTIMAALAGFLLTRVLSGPAQTTGEASKAKVTSSSGPRLSINQPVVEFGNVAYNQRVNPEWTLTNVGDAPLQIRDLRLKVEAG